MDVITAFGDPAADRAKRGDADYPIVSQSAMRSVGAGLVASSIAARRQYHRVTILPPELSAKRLELLQGDRADGTAWSLLSRTRTAGTVAA